MKNIQVIHSVCNISGITDFVLFERQGQKYNLDIPFDFVSQSVSIKLETSRKVRLLEQQF